MCGDSEIYTNIGCICNLQTHCQCHQENWAPSFRFCSCRLNWLWTILFTDYCGRFESIHVKFVGICSRSSGGRCAHNAHFNWPQDRNNSKFPNIHSTRHFPFYLKFDIYHLPLRARSSFSMQNQRISFFCKMYKMLAEVTSIHTVPILLHKVNAQSRVYGLPSVVHRHYQHGNG